MKIGIPKSMKDLKTAGKEVLKANARMFDPLDMVMPGVADAVGLGDIYGKQKGPDYSGYDAEQARALADQRAAYEEFVRGGAPRFEVGDEISYEELDPSRLAQLGQSEMGDITTDPRYHDYELEALRQLEEQSNDGFSARDRADLARIEQNASRANAGRQGAIQQDLQNRGLGGSGLEFALRQQAAQDAAEQEAIASLEKGAQVLERKQSASARLGDISAQLQSRDFDQAARKAAAADAINEFNVRNQLEQQRQNNQIRNTATQTNWERANQVADNNVNAGYGFRKDKLGAKNQNAQNAFNASADSQNRAMMQDAQNAENKAGMMGALGGAAGGIAGAFFGGPAGATAGWQIGQGVGQAAGRRRGYAHGGKVEATAEDLFPGDHPANDIVEARLSPGEIVIPRSIADDPAKAAEFVAEENGQDNDVVGLLLTAMQALNKRK